MTLLEFVKGIGGRIVFTGGVGFDNNSMLVVIQQESKDLRIAGTGSLNGWAKLGKDLNVTYDKALSDLAVNLSGKQVRFDSTGPMWVAPQLTHKRKGKS